MRSLSTGLTRVITVVALAFSGFFIYCGYRAHEAGREAPQVSLLPIECGYTTRLVEVALPQIGGYVMTEWLGLVTNTTDRTTSILSYHLLEDVQLGWMLCSYVDQGCVDRNGEEIRFPLTLESGHSLVFRLAIGIGLGTESFAALERLYAPGDQMLIRDIRSEMARLIREQKGAALSRLPPQMEFGERHYLLEFHTACANTLSALGQWCWCHQRLPQT
jgi:hypothetical protein